MFENYPYLKIQLRLIGRMLMNFVRIAPFFIKDAIRIRLSGNDLDRMQDILDDQERVFKVLDQIDRDVDTELEQAKEVLNRRIHKFKRK